MDLKMNASKNVSILGNHLGTKLKVKATSTIMGVEVVKTKVGWHRIEWDGVVSEGVEARARSYGLARHT